MRPIELSRFRFSKMNPFAPPNRRVQIAKICRDYGVNPSFRRDDKFTWELWIYLKKLEAAHEPDQRAHLLMIHRGLSVAFQLHHGAMRHLRPVIEAYILAGADDESIAKKLAVPTEAICWFRLAFYDIEHLRNAPLYVVHHLIGITDGDGQCALDLHRIWKLIGYKLKSEGLDELFFDSRDNGETFKVGDVAAWFSRQTLAILESKRFVAMNTLSADDPKHVEILLKLLQKQRKEHESEATSSTTLERHINAMLDEIPWTCGAVAQEVYKTTEVGKWDEGAVELRDEELLLLAAGEEVPGLDKIKDLKIPLSRDSVATSRPDKDVEK